MSSISISLTPGYLFQEGDLLTPALLRLIAQPAVNLEGSLGTAQINDGAVTLAKLAAGTLTADSDGLVPFENKWLNAAYADWDCGPGQTSRNVVIFNNTVAPNSKMDLTAEEVVLKDSTGGVFLATAVTLTMDVAVNGSANGLDTLPGTGVAANTWYYLWLIADGTTVQGLISTSATAPTLPSGYTFKALVGAVRTDASSHFQVVRIINRQVFCAPINLFSAMAATTSWVAYTTTGAAGSVANVATAVPLIAKHISGVFGCTAVGSLGVAGDATGLGAQYVAGGAGTAFDTFVVAGNFNVPVTVANTIYIKASGTSGINRLSVTGYEF